ncbi:hypothetical protein GQX73_g3553 [Xylaria multiplex]|uniref:Uncharacterized protein n=1 Tax=Xylaria multiplex TaxID=323545 RepID=A0A7C8MWA2_9PEZI|nr:hypothetical protein GQX73_g3553 [Xylaria multiplex]
MTTLSTNIDSGSTIKPTIQDFGLRRGPWRWEPKDTAFIDTYLVLSTLNNSSRPSSPNIPTPEWTAFKIELPRPASSRSADLLNGYAVSPSHHAYVTFCVELTRDTTRLTPMRYRDMLADNYASSSPSTSLSQLRWLGVSNILNLTARATFMRLFQLSNRDILSQGRVEVCPDTDLSEAEPDHKELRALLLHDPFARGVLALLHHHAQDLGHAFVKRFVFISEGWEGRAASAGPSVLELRLNLVVELARPGDNAGVVKADISKELLANL